jgi:hypothetical protein
MIPISQIKWFTMREKVGKAPAYIRKHIGESLRTARQFKPQSEDRAFYLGLARGTASMWPLCNGGNKG